MTKLGIFSSFAVKMVANLQFELKPLWVFFTSLQWQFESG